MAAPHGGCGGEICPRSIRPPLGDERDLEVLGLASLARLLEAGAIQGVTSLATTEVPHRVAQVILDDRANITMFL